MDPKFSIVSDGSCDLPEQVVREKDVSIVHFLVSFDGSEYKKEGVEIALEDFYQRMVDDPKTYPKTAAPSPADFYRAFQNRAEQGRDILCVCISTKLSSSVQSAEIARQMLQEEYPHIRVAVVDSLCATLMQSVYVLEACRLRDAGRSFEETLQVMEELRKTARILFTVGNLDYIQHGGRIGKMTNIAGTLLNIKPLITLQDGEIHSSGIRRGRRRSLEGIAELLVDYLRENHCTPEDCNILIGYSYDRQEGCQLQEITRRQLTEAFGSDAGTELPICRIGATIGVHAGPTSIGYGVVRRSDRLS
ncbi:MAG: DegV family protein [Oscillospiraceae bacterium]